MAADRPSKLMTIPPPLIFLLAFLAGIAVDKVIPWYPAWIDALAWIGWLMIAIGILLAPVSAALFARKRTTLSPIGQPSALVTGGVYRITRNPMYIGLSLIHAGLAIVLGYAWALVLVAVPWLVMNFVVIPGEEAKMRAIFGDEYLDYCRRVRRWL